MWQKKRVNPWVVGVDINVIRFSYEKRGGCTIILSTRDFSNWVGQQDLIDLPMSWVSFTRTNKKANPVLSKLDRQIFCYIGLVGSQIVFKEHWLGPH